MADPSFLAAALRGSATAVLLVDGGRPLAGALEFARDSTSRRRGLLGRDGLAPGAAFIIAPCSAIHTFGMRFPIDVVFAARDGRVLKVVHRLASWRVAFAVGAWAAIELEAGVCDRCGVRAGDLLAVSVTG